MEHQTMERAEDGSIYLHKTFMPRYFFKNLIEFILSERVKEKNKNIDIGIRYTHACVQSWP